MITHQSSRQEVFLYQIRQFLQFYAKAVTKYQLHSPYGFELVNAVLEDDRYYYAFRDVETVRAKMLESDVVLQVSDFGAGGEQHGASRQKLRDIVRRAASTPAQGRGLFRLVNLLRPATMLEIGTSVGVGAMYLASAARNARFISLEGCPQLSAVARANLEILALPQPEIVSGPFEKTLLPTLQSLQSIDFVYIDGNHRPGPTLQYFEACLPYAHNKTVFVFDDAYWSPGMTKAWRAVQQHPGVRFTLDFFNLSLAFVNPDFREIQHIRAVPACWKPWKFF